MSVPKRCTIWSSAPGTGASEASFSIRRSRRATASRHCDRLAVAIDRPRGEIAFRVGEGLVELHRKGMGEVVENVFARRDVDLHVAPFLGRDLGKPALHQRFAGGDDLDDGGMARLQIALDRADQRGRLHRGDEVIEEALLGALEGGARGGLRLRVQRAGLAGDVGGLHRRVEIVVDDRERPGIGVVDADLLVGELVLDQFVFDALVAERARRIEAEGLEVARQHFHRRDAAGLDGFDELGPRGEGKILAAPEAEALGIGEIVNGGGAGRRDIDDARIRQRVLEAQARRVPAARRPGRRARLCRRRRSASRGSRRK